MAAAKSNDHEKLSALAHKMTPMLKQLEAWQIVRLIEPLEHRKLDMGKAEVSEYVSVICEKMQELFEGLSVEMN
ncbi:MAG: hypothetical protein EON97_01365 [Chitinophagaceae bacterium]|nr:MAG: hypothetical protein EON97_01365 [Chitinophagaceae bacterium]